MIYVYKKEKRMGLECTCTDWKKSWPQIENTQVMAYMNHVTFIHKMFAYCPWCGEKLQEK